MRYRFTRVCYALAATAAVTTTLGLSAVGAASASASTHTVKPAATPSCGAGCANLYTEEFGPHQVQGVYRGSVTSGRGSRIVLSQASNSQPGEDFTVQVVAPVSVLCATWPAPGSLSPTSYACLNYRFPLGVFQVLEGNYQPYGSPTSLCAGVASSVPFSGESVTLQSCGSPNTEWVVDTNNFAFFFSPPFPPSGPYAPLVNAGDTPSSGPQVLTVRTTHRSPRHPLVTERLNRFSDGTVSDSQQWGVFFGTAP